MKFLFFDFNVFKFYNCFFHFYICFQKSFYFLIYSVSFSLVKSALCNKFMVSFSEPLMFKIAILLKLMDMINKSWHLSQTFCWNYNLRNSNCDKYYTLLIHCFVNINSFGNANSIMIYFFYNLYKHSPKKTCG